LSYRTVDGVSEWSLQRPLGVRPGLCTGWAVLEVATTELVFQLLALLFSRRLA
jgi:hypothetical protein